MFSENNRISVRQAVRNYGMMVISISALVIPTAMNHTAMPSVLLAAGLLGVYLSGMAVSEAPENRIFRAASYVHGWILGTLTARMTGVLVQEFLLNGAPLWGILILFYAMCYYNLYKGLECRMRVGEILFLPFLLLLAGLAIAMHGEAEVMRIREFRWILDQNGVWKGYELFCWLTAVQGLWSLQNHMTEKKTAVGRVWLLGTAGVVFWALFTFFIYGDAGHTGLVFPLASAMTLGTFAGKCDWQTGFYICICLGDRAFYSLQYPVCTFAGRRAGSEEKISVWSTPYRITGICLPGKITGIVVWMAVLDFHAGAAASSHLAACRTKRKENVTGRTWIFLYVSDWLRASGAGKRKSDRKHLRGCGNGESLYGHIWVLHVGRSSRNLPDGGGFAGGSKEYV